MTLTITKHVLSAARAMMIRSLSEPIAIGLLVGALVGGPLAGKALPTEIGASTVDCGGATSTGGPYALTGTIGQPDAAGASLGADLVVTGGFWAAADVPCFADLDASGDVGFSDILAIIGAWGPCGVPCPEDLNGNGSVDFADLLSAIGAWGACP